MKCSKCGNRKVFVFKAGVRLCVYCETKVEDEQSRDTRDN